MNSPNLTGVMDKANPEIQILHPSTKVIFTLEFLRSNVHLVESKIQFDEIKTKIIGMYSILNFFTCSKIISKSENIRKIEYSPIAPIIMRIRRWSNFIGHSTHSNIYFNLFVVNYFIN